MKALVSSFLQFCNQIAKDSMLLVVCVAPILCGSFFKFCIPIAEKMLTDYFGAPSIIAPYYLLFDLFLAVVTSYMFCFASAMVILGEIDDNLSTYLAVTPIGKSGYLLSRLGFPMFISVIVTWIILPIFSLTELSVITMIILSALSGLVSVIAAMFIVTLSSNKVEGMALSKLAGIFMLGLPIPFFMTGSAQYIAFFLPTFWIAKIAISANYRFVIVAIISLGAWGFVLYRKFANKVL